MFGTVTSVATTVSLIIILAALLWVAYQRWLVHHEPAPTKVIEDATSRLVESAEEKFRAPGSGNAKFVWVMNRLNASFSGYSWDELDDLVHAAVYRLNRDKATRNAIIHRNGTTPRNAEQS